MVEQIMHPYCLNGFVWVKPKKYMRAYNLILCEFSLNLLYKYIFHPNVTISPINFDHGFKKLKYLDISI